MKKVGVFLIFVSLVMIGLGVYKLYFNPKKIILKALSHQIEMVKDVDFDLKKERITSSLSINDLDQLLPSASLINTAKCLSDGNTKCINNTRKTLKFSGDTYIDPSANNYYGKYNIKLTGDPEMSADFSSQFLYKDKMIYFYIKELVDKVMYFSIEDINDYKISKEEMNIYFDEVLKIMNEYFTDDMFSTKKEKITINSNSISTTKYTINLTALDVYELTSRVFTEVKNNKSLSNIKKILFTDISESNYLSSLKRQIIGSKDEKRQMFQYSVYLKNLTDAVKIDFCSSGSKVSLAWFDSGNNSKAYEFLIQNDNENLFELSINGNDKLKNIRIIGEDLYSTGTYEFKDSIKSLNLSIFDANDRNTSLGEIKYEYNTSSNVSDKLNITSKNGFSLLMENKYSDFESFPKFDISKAQKLTEIDGFLN